MAMKKVITLMVIYMVDNLLAASILDNTTDNNKVDFHDVSINLQYKLDKFTEKLSHVDESLQSLQEKSNTWLILRHHIDAWNGQMQALELKLEAIQRWQKSKDTDGVKWSNLEFTLNQILSKVVLMTDTCQSYNEKKESNIHEEAQFETTARLNNILHFIHNLDYKRICEAKKKKISKQQQIIENENSQNSNSDIVGENNYLKTCENNKLITMTNFKDVKKLHEQTKKNTRSLDNLTSRLGNIEKKLLVWHDDAENNVNYMTKQCQSASKELSTFSESSQLLLKRIEFLVHDVDQKLYGVDVNNNNTIVEQAENDRENQEQYEKYEYDMIMTEMPTEHEEILPISKEDVDELTDDYDERKNAVNFIQPHIAGCHELNIKQRIDGIYKFQSPLRNIAGRDFNERLCVFGESGTAWTVIQNRGPYVEQENFNRSWSDYRLGFGNLHKDFWFGNEFIHTLVNQNDYELRIDMENFENEIIWVEYKMFRIESEANNYNLLIDEYQGTVGDAMKYHNNMDFSTYDHRNERSVCAIGYGSGWWFNK